MKKKTKAAKRAKLLSTIDGWTCPNLEKLNESTEPQERKVLLINALNYANYAFEQKFLKSQVLEYTKKNMDIKTNSIPEWELVHIGSMCWLYNNDVTSLDMKDVHGKIKTLLEKYKTKKETKTSPTLTDIANKNTDKIIEIFEGIIDDVYNGEKNIEQPINILRDAGKFKIAVVESHFQKQLDDFENYPEEYEDCKKERAALEFIMNHIGVYRGEQKSKKVTKVKRKVKRKVIPPSKLVKKLKYCKKDEEHDVSSINPELIIGANVLWIFNTKNRMLTQYVAADDAGLMVKGTSILNYDEKKSRSKLIRENVIKSTLNLINESGKVTQRTILDNIKSVAKIPKKIINDNCILFKVYK